MDKQQIDRLIQLQAVAAKDYHKLSEEEQQELFDLEAAERAEEHIKLLGEIEGEAMDRIWYDRNSIGTGAEKPGTPEDIRKAALAAAERIRKQYNLDKEELDDFYHGYWSGILALSRFISGYYDVNIEDLREGNNGLLDS